MLKLMGCKWKLPIGATYVCGAWKSISLYVHVTRLYTVILRGIQNGTCYHGLQSAYEQYFVNESI